MFAKYLRATRGWQTTVPGPNEPTPVFVNEVVLEYSRRYSFTYHLWLFLHYKDSAAQLYQRPYEPQLHIFIAGPSFTEKIC